MKIQKVFEVEAAINTALSAITDRKQIKHLRAAKRQCLEVTEQERETLKQPESVKAFSRALQEWSNELNSMTQEKRAEKLADLRAEFPTSRQDAIDWKKLHDDTMEEEVEMSFTAAPAETMFKNSKLVIDPRVFDLLCEVGIFREDPDVQLV